MRKNTSRSLSVYIFVLAFSLACTTFSAFTETPSPASTVETEKQVDLISVSGSHSCALKNGTVYCWGLNDAGELGDGTLTKRNTAVIVPGLNNVTSISAGGEHTCALLDSGDVKCWGRNSSWQLGDETNISRTAPTDVKLNGKAIAISAGNEHTCALMSNGEVKCWGKNLYGRLGTDSSDRLGKAPETVKNLEGVIRISTGAEHTCALTSTGAVKCWGHSPLGDDTDKNAKVPVDVVNLGKNVLSISAGTFATCAIKNNNEVDCWGFFSPQQESAIPEHIKGFDDDIVDIATGGSYICGITKEGAVKCLGENEYGQLGNGTTNATYMATSVSNLTGKALEISASSLNACALLESGDIVCWGENSAGQLGDGTYNNSTEPVTVLGFK